MPTATAPRIFYYADTEGDLKALLRAFSSYLGLKNDDEEVVKLAIKEFLKGGGQLILGGDYPDAKKTGYERNLLRFLVELIENYPNNVTYILGNRDINKLRFKVEDPVTVFEWELTEIQQAQNMDDLFGEKRLKQGGTWTDNKNSVWFVHFLFNKFNNLKESSEDLTFQQLIDSQDSRHKFTTWFFETLNTNERSNYYREWALANTMGASQTWESLKSRTPLGESPEIEYNSILSDMDIILKHGKLFVETPFFTAQHGALGNKFDELVISIRDIIGEKKWSKKLKEYNKSSFPEMEVVNDLFREHLSTIEKVKTSKENGLVTRQTLLYDLFQEIALPTSGQKCTVQHHWSQTGCIKSGTVAHRVLFTEDDQKRPLITGHTPHGDVPGLLRRFDDKNRLSNLIVRADISQFASQEGTVSTAYVVCDERSMWHVKGTSREVGHYDYRVEPGNYLQGISLNPNDYSEKDRMNQLLIKHELGEYQNFTLQGKNLSDGNYNFFQQEGAPNFRFMFKSVKPDFMEQKVLPFLKEWLPDYAKEFQNSFVADQEKTEDKEVALRIKTFIEKQTWKVRACRWNNSSIKTDSGFVNAPETIAKIYQQLCDIGTDTGNPTDLLESVRNTVSNKLKFCGRVNNLFYGRDDTTVAAYEQILIMINGNHTVQEEHEESTEEEQKNLLRP